MLLVASLLLAGLSAGCMSSSRYPDDLRYHVRTDPLVTKIPEKGPAHLPPPGKIDEHIVSGGAETVDPNKLDANQRKELAAALDAAFGTPPRPKVDLEALGAMASEEIDNLLLDKASLRRGSELYRRHCLHCHGVTGDGRGPTGPWVHPHPRDYRSPGPKGEPMFKYISSIIPPETTARKPRRSDLLRTITRGIDGTSMPSFGLLPEKELQLLVSYVIHLSLRGEVEFKTIRALADKSLEGDVKKKVAEEGSALLTQWAQATALPPNVPPAYPYKDDDSPEASKQLADSIGRGYKLFIGDGICITCHFDFGRQSAYRYDIWGTLVQPRNLTAGVFRGGRRPLDLYYRISGGIPPSDMPAFAPKVSRSLPPAEQEKARAQAYWDVINFVQALPYPAMLPKDVREKIYGSSMQQPAEKTQHASR